MTKIVAYPDFYPSRIPDLGSRIQKQEQKRGVKKKIFVIPFYVATNFTKLNIILVLKSLRKNLGKFSKNYRTFLPKKLSPSSQKYGFGIRDPEKTYSGSRGQKGTGSRIRNTAQHWRKASKPVPVLT
jgi:hypothetical protein